MNKNDAEKLIMYYEIHKRKLKGDNPTRIARYLVMDYRTVIKYLNMSEEQYIEFLEDQRLVRYTEDGRWETDNNLMENSYKPLI